MPDKLVAQALVANERGDAAGPGVACLHGRVGERLGTCRVVAVHAGEREMERRPDASDDKICSGAHAALHLVLNDVGDALERAEVVEGVQRRCDAGVISLGCLAGSLIPQLATVHVQLRPEARVERVNNLPGIGRADGLRAVERAAAGGCCAREEKADAG